MNRTFVFRLFIIHLAVGICGARAIAATASSPVSRNDPQANAQAARVQKAADDAITAAYATADKGDFDKACAQADDALGQLVASGAKADDAFRQIALARRLLGQLKKVDPSVRTDLYQYLRKNDPLAKAMAFGLADGKDGKDAYLLLDRLRKKFPNVAQLPNLAAAISLTHDKPIQTHLNENIVKSADPLELYAYFTANEKRMSFGLRNVPVELLVYVVDTTASIAELNWALEHYAGRQNIGDLFAMVRYDESAFSRGTQKAVSANGYNLPNVLRYGGVCVDQAYFAEQVGKAIGVPTATDKGRSSEVSHAWVGFLQFNGKQGLWNFDSGRYASYKHVRGDVRDPQTRESIPDSFVAILGESIGSDPKDRELAAAYVDAAQMIIESGQVPRAAAAAGSPGKQPTSQGSPSVAALDLIESGLRHNQWYLPGWTAVGDLAQKS
ncbi:MAG TPA: hypothetical protein VL282_17590, partial [Tepidisphaeraceae bacterium]|nr:hypothetical protein [Tepidisphaeraceae bacterium]